MEIGFEFGVGRLEEISHEEVEKTNSIEELNIPQSSGKIIIPIVIGVYQKYIGCCEKHKREDDSMAQIQIFELIGEREEISPDLICMIYDPTILDCPIVRDYLKGDILKRVKITSSLELPNFYEKELPSINETIEKIFINKTDNNVSVLKKEKEIFDEVRKNYGLTRLEAVDLETANDLLRKMKKGPRVIDDLGKIRYFMIKHRIR